MMKMIERLKHKGFTLFKYHTKSIQCLVWKKPRRFQLRMPKREKSPLFTSQFSNHSFSPGPSPNRGKFLAIFSPYMFTSLYNQWPCSCMGIADSSPLFVPNISINIADERNGENNLLHKCVFCLKIFNAI